MLLKLTKVREKGNEPLYVDHEDIRVITKGHVSGNTIVETKKSQYFVAESIDEVAEMKRKAELESA